MLNIALGVRYVVKIFIVVIMSCFGCLSANAWEGYDWENGSSIEIESGNLVRSGEEIEIYDWENGQYKNVEVQDINRYGSSVEVEVYDYDTGEFRTFDMDD